MTVLTQGTIQEQPKDKGTPKDAVPVVMRTYSIPVAGRQTAILQVPTPLTEKGLQSLKNFLNLMGDSMLDEEAE
jgi:hypothetical protein